MNGQEEAEMVREYDKVMATAEAMQKTGGSFVAALGVALMKADTANRAKIQAAFPEYIERYRTVAEMNDWYRD